MAIAYKSVGTSTATGATVAIFNYPAGISAGDFIVLGVVNKYPPNAPSTLTGYTFPVNGQGTGGDGAAGTDGGTVFTTAYYKVATGSETGAATVTVASGNSSGANVTVYTKTDAQYDWATPVAGWGADSTRGTSWIITAGSTMDIMLNDMVVVVSGANADAQTYSAEVFSCGGLTIGTNNERLDVAITGGNDCRLVMSTHTITAGTATTAGTFTMTASGTLSAGASVMVRLREQWARGTVSPAEGAQAQAGDTAIVFGAYPVASEDGFQTQAMDAIDVSYADGSGPVLVTPGDGFQAQTGDAATVRAGYPLTVAEGAQSQTGDAAVVRAGYVVTFTEGNQTQTGDAAIVSYAGPTMSWDVTPGDGFQAQAGDTATVRTTYLVSPVDGFQTQTGDSAVVFAGYFVISDQGFQTQTMDEVTVSLLSAAASQTPKRKTIKAEDTQLIATGFVDKVSVVMKGEPPYP